MRWQPLLVGATLIALVATGAWHEWQASVPPSTPLPMAVEPAPVRPTATAPDDAIPVAVELARLGSVQESLTVAGVVVPATEETVIVHHDGVVREVKVAVGAHVQEGDLLAVMATPTAHPKPSPSPSSTLDRDLKRMDSQIQTAQSDVQESQEELERAQAALAKVQAVLDDQQARAQQDQGLLQCRAVSQQDVETDAAAVRKTSRQADQAQAKVDQAQRDLARKQALVQQYRTARLEIENAARVLPTPSPETPDLLDVDNHGHLESPLSGVVTRCYVVKGQALKARARLFTITRLDIVRIESRVDRSALKALHQGTVVQVQAAALPFSLQAELVSVGKDGRIETLLANPDEKLVPGTVVKVQLPVQHRGSVVTIPAAALVHDGPRLEVWTVHSSGSHAVALEVPVQAGAQDGDRIEIEAGLSVGDMVIWKGAEGLHNGTPVLANPTDTGDEPTDDDATASPEGSPHEGPQGP